MRADFVDYYARLGLTKGCSDADIKQAYRRRVKTCHPDLVHNQRSSLAAEEEFKRISEAYSVLSKSISRVDYDLDYTRHETAAAARKHEELQNMRRCMRVYARKSNESAARRERRDPNRPPHRRPLLMRRETAPPAWLGWFFLLLGFLALAGFMRALLSSVVRENPFY